MSNKRWLTAILIIGVLAIAFFWGGDYGKSPTKLAEGHAETGGISETSSPYYTQEQLDEADSDQADIVAITQPDVEGVNDDKDTSNDDQSINTVTEESLDVTNSDKSSKVDKPIDKSVEKPVDTVEQKSEKPPSKKKEEPTGATTSEPKKDKYLTDPVPEGKPKPVEWQDVNVDKEKKLTVTLSVTAKTILDNMDSFNKDKLEVLPEGGVIYKAQTVTFYEGESVFDVLLREMKKNKIHMEFSMTPIYNSNYVEGINNLYEFDCGELSGWMYKVNGWFPNYGSSRYVLKDGDVVDWVYTCDLGRDIGGDVAVKGEGKQ